MDTQTTYGRKMRILVVDDEPGIRDLIRDAVSRLGHQVVEAENGIDALVRLAEHSVDLMFLDIRMPKSDGITVLKEVRRLWPDVPVVMITGCGEREPIEESLSLGSSLCLMKPFSIRDVTGVLDVVAA